MKTNFTQFTQKVTSFNKTLFFALLFTSCLSLETVTAQYTLTIDDVTFDSATGSITDYLADSVNIIIPESFNVNNTDVNVTTIGEWAFYKNSLTNVTIPNSVTYIGEYAFRYNSLTSITIPNSVTFIGSGAFLRNSLTSVNFEDNSNIRFIGNSAFANNSGLLAITLPSNANQGFTEYKDSNGNSYNAGDDITDFSISYNAVLPPHTLTLNDVKFETETGIITDYFGGYTDIITPSAFSINGTDISVTSIGNSAFSYSSLTSVTIPNSVTYIGNSAFTYNSLTSVTIPNSVITIEEKAFAHNSLTSITIPNSVTYIGDGAFNNNAITQINGVTSNGIIYARKNDGTDNLTIIVSYGGTADVIDFIPNIVTTISEGSFQENTLTSITIPNSITTIERYAFSYNSLTSVTIPNSVITIGKKAFAHNSLTSVTIPNSVITIGKAAFYYNSLTSITIPNSIITIEERAFAYNSLTSVTIPESVTSIGYEAFMRNSLTSITIPNSVISIDTRAFSSNSLTNVTIPNSVTSIGHEAFSYNSLMNITIPNSVTTIGGAAFYNNSLTSVNFEKNSNIRLINEYAFDQNSGLSTITLPSNINQEFAGYKDSSGNNYNGGDQITNFSVVYYAVLPIHNLTLNDVKFEANTGTITYYSAGYVNIIIPSSFKVDGTFVDVTSIGKWAFELNFLMGVTIPNSVTTIERDAFSYNALTKVTIPNSVTTIERYAFSNNSLASVTIPNSVTTIERYAFYKNPLTSISLPNPVIKEGYTFTEWHNGNSNVVTEISDFDISYEAQFDFTGVMVSGRITTGDEQELADKGLKSVMIDDVEGVTLYLSGDITGTKPVNADGTYSFALNAGRSIVITPVKENYSFSPENITLNNVQTNFENQDFTPVITSINNQDAAQIKVFPNPVHNVLTIETTGIYNQLEIINLTGAVLNSINCTGLITIKTNMSNLSPGVYFIKLTGEESMVIKKLIKK